MKDKKFGGDSLDADLDKYWKKKEEEPDKQGLFDCLASCSLIKSGFYSLCCSKSSLCITYAVCNRWRRDIGDSTTSGSK
jgi:hypothetical protein